MRNLLSQASREVLEQFAWSSAMLGLDFDGTLAPIVDEPDRAYMRPETQALLKKVAELYPTVVISGRAQADVQRRIEGVGVREIVGNHGLEPWHGTESLTDKVAQWIGRLEPQFAELRGVQIEDKRFSLAVHFRQSREKKKARAAIFAAASALTGSRIVGGKQVVNVLPEGAPHKGIALERERDRLGCDTAIYVGDDETDEDVFALDRPGRLLTVRVGAKRTSAASYFIARQSDIDELLRLLIELRPRRGLGKLAAR